MTRPTVTQGFVLIAATAGFIAVALGAFGAHGLKNILSTDMLNTWQTAVDYQFVHALAIMACAWMSETHDSVSVRVSAYSFTVGIVVFSGSLYVLSLSGIGWLGAITPIGGVAFLIGWAALAHAACRWERSG